MHAVFRHFCAREEDDNLLNKKRLAYAAWLVDAIPNEDFEPEEQLFNKFVQFCSKLDVPIKRKYLDTWLSTELRRTLRQTNIQVTGCEGLHYDDAIAFETAVRTSTAVMQDTFDDLVAMPSDLEDFRVEISEYFNEQRSERLRVALTQAFDALQETSDASLAGDIAQGRFASINSVYSDEVLEDLFYEAGSTGLTDIISRSGIPIIDKDSMCLARKQLFSIDAQPGTGKTRLAIGGYAYETLTHYKKNVGYFSLEQSVEELDAMLIARHIFTMFGKQIDSKLIHRNQVPDNLKAEVEAAKYDLFESGKYGKWYRVTTDMTVETFIDKIKNADRLHGPFDLIIIDHAGLISSQPLDRRSRVLEKYECIGESYKLFKRYVRRANKAGIFLLQFNDAGITAGEKDLPITPNMAEGGTQAYKHTDYNIAISMTETMKAQQKRRVRLPKVRDSAGFPPFIVDTRLAFCYWYMAAETKV